MLQATEYHLGQLKAKLAKLRTELQAPAAVSVHGLALRVQPHTKSLHVAHQKPSSGPVSGISSYSTGYGFVAQIELNDCGDSKLML